MALVDDRGRAFGRFNPVDVFVFALVVVMIPIAYGAYALFRTPPAKLARHRAEAVHDGPEPSRAGQRHESPPVHARVVQHRAGPNLHDRQHDDGRRGSARSRARRLRRRPVRLRAGGRSAAESADDPAAGGRADRDPVGGRPVRGAEPGAGRRASAGREVRAEQSRQSAPCSLSAARRPGALQMRTGETGIAVSMPGLVRLAGGARARVLPREQHAKVRSAAWCTVRRTPRPWSRTRSCRCRCPAAR